MGAVRFAVRGHREGEQCSERWTAFSSANELYLIPKSAAGLAKISVHSSGVCRFALTAELGSHRPPAFEDDRVILRWERGSIKDVQHTHVLSIFFVLVGGGLSRPPEDKKATVLLPNAPTGFCTEVALFMSETDPLKWTDGTFIPANIISSFALPNGTFVTFRSRVSPLTDEEFQAVIAGSAGQNQFHFGARNPEVVDPGPADALIPVSWQSHAKFYQICPITMAALMGSTTHWSTRSGNRSAVG